uniref:Lipoprotein n=1 Tax=Streptomyces sp. NBC_00049 TaxID=2903617 RepID=A0AAU2JNR1_9ACTN
MPKNSRPRIVDTILRNLLAYGVVVAALLTMAGCDVRLQPTEPAVFDARSSEVVGTWRCVEGTEIDFHSDGTATVTLLDGQEYDYDHGWRISGPATWKLTAEQPAGWNLGQHLRLDLPARTHSGTRAAVGREAKPAPERYDWVFELRRDERRGLELYFYLGNSGDNVVYVLEKDA